MEIFIIIHKKIFIIKKNNIKRNIYPEYICDTDVNIESLKRKFRKIASRYILDDNNNLCIKRKNITAKFFNSTQNKNLNSNSLFTIPFTKNIKEFL